MRVIKQIKTMFCKHKNTDWPTLIFCGGRNTHRMVAECLSCGTSITLFAGTRYEWLAYIGCADFIPEHERRNFTDENDATTKDSKNDF